MESLPGDRGGEESTKEKKTNSVLVKWDLHVLIQCVKFLN